MYPDVPPGGAVAYPTRPGYRKFGDVRATQLIVEVAAARDQHHYDGGPFCFFKPTACKPESLMAIFGIIWGSQNSFPVIKQFVLLCKESQLGKRMPAYGGMKSIYTAGPLPVASKDSVVKLAEKDGPGVFVLPMAAQAHLPPPMAQASALAGRRQLRRPPARRPLRHCRRRRSVLFTFSSLLLVNLSLSWRFWTQKSFGFSKLHSGSY
ncbi:hypothetical protein ACFX13_044874 [Malus domestica]